MTAFFIFSMFKIFSNLFNFSLFVALIKKLSIPTAVLELGLTVISLGLIKKFSPICLISWDKVAEKNKNENHINNAQNNYYSFKDGGIANRKRFEIKYNTKMDSILSLQNSFNTKMEKEEKK